MIIDIGDIIYWEGVPHKVKEIVNEYDIGDEFYTYYFDTNIKGSVSKYMQEGSYMYKMIIEKFYKIDNKIMPLSIARDMRIDEILND